jgi:hypothetical protein
VISIDTYVEFEFYPCALYIMLCMPKIPSVLVRSHAMVSRWRGGAAVAADGDRYCSRA